MLRVFLVHEKKQGITNTLALPIDKRCCTWVVTQLIFPSKKPFKKFN
jgi:hypothetical protein